MLTKLLVLSAGFSFLSAAVSLFLLWMAIRVFARTRDPTMAFLTGAFSLFAFKSFIVGYALVTNAIQHDSLELMDAMGDLATLLLLVTPIFVGPKRDA